jgi:hypothetical protein
VGVCDFSHFNIGTRVLVLLVNFLVGVRRVRICLALICSFFVVYEFLFLSLTSFYEASTFVYCLLCIACNLFYGVSVPHTIHNISTFNCRFTQRTLSIFGINIVLKYNLLYDNLVGSFVLLC